MKNLKKVLALVLAMVLVIGSVASAKSYTDVKPEDNAAAYEAIDALSTLGLIDGYEDGTYKPEKILNRAEGAKLIAAALSKKDLINERPVTGFVDVDGVKGFDWARGYIDYLEGKNVNGTSIVIGIGDNKFAPERELSYKEFVKMLVVALGYAPLTNGDYDAYLGVADSIGLLENVPVNNINEDDKVSRGDAAILLYNAVRIHIMVPSGITALGYVVSTTDFLLTEAKNISYLGLAPDEDFNIASDDVLDPIFTGTHGELSGIEYTDGTRTVSFALNDYLTTSLIRANIGRNVEGIFYDATSLDQSKNYDEMLYIDFGADKTTKTTYDIKESGFKVEARDSKGSNYVATINGKEVKYEVYNAVTDIAENWFNSMPVSSATDADKFINHKGTITFVESYYGDLLAVLADTYTDGIVTKVDATRNEIHINEFENTTGYPTCVYQTNKDIVIKVDSVANVKKGDYVAVTVGSDYTTVEVITTAVTGKVEKVNTYKDGTVKYVINGTEYMATLKDGVRATYNVGDEGTFYLAKDGTIRDFVAKAVPSNKDWVVLIGATNNETVKVMSLTTGAVTTYHVANTVPAMTANTVYEITLTQTASGPFITKADVVNWNLNNSTNEYTYVKAANVLAKVDATVGAGFALEADAKVITGVADTTAVKDITALKDGYTYNDVRATDIDGNGLADIVRINNAPSKDLDAAAITTSNKTYAVVKEDYKTDGGLKDTLKVYINGKEQTIKTEVTGRFNSATAGQVYEVEFSTVLGKEDVVIKFDVAYVAGNVGNTAASNGLVTKIVVGEKTYYLTANTQYYTRVEEAGKYTYIKPTNETTIKKDSKVTINANEFGFVTDIVITEVE